jgi:hypothetical protein
MNKKLVGILAAVTTAGAAIIVLTKNAPPPAAPPTETATETTLPVETPSPTLEAQYKPCYYVWANNSLPEISSEFQTAVDAILPGAEASASAYGENCVADDGSFTFGAMETDFYVKISVRDISNETDLGGIIERVLTLIIDQFPRPHVPGGQDGFVEFTFSPGPGQRIVRVPIPTAKEFLAQGLHGNALFQAMVKQ